MKVRSVLNFSLVVVTDDEPAQFQLNQMLKAVLPVLPEGGFVSSSSQTISIDIVSGPEVQHVVSLGGIQSVTPSEQAIAAAPSEQIDPPAAGEPAPQKKARKPKAEKPAAAEQTQEPEKNPNFKQFTGDDVRNALRAALAAGVDGDDVNQLLIKRGYDNITAIGENQKVFANIIEEAKKLIARVE